jgi:type I restriction enzyme, S subunit
MTGKYPKYASYAETKVKTLGCIPSHWVTKRLKQMARIKNGQDYKHVETSNAEDGYPVIGSGGRFTYASEFMYDGESVLLGRKGTVDKPLYVNCPFWTVDTMFYTQVFKSTCGRYLYYCSITIPFNYYSTNTALPSMTQEDLGGNYFAVPEYCEQLAIANFLDHETAKIDTLIDKQQQLIKLLKEKRQARISHAVTKGLNPDAPMKDSCVEWLGEVPEHWVVARYKFCTSRIVVGIAEAATHAYADSGVPIIRSTNIGENGIRTSDILYITEVFAEQNESKYLYANDVVTVRTGFPGISSVIPDDLNKSQCFTNLIATPTGSHVPDFLAQYLNSHTGKSYFDLLAWGSAQKNISVPILQNVPIAYPPHSEQRRIMEYVSSQRRRFDDLIAKASRSIELMQERRTALISAAVTGKIDVRHWQPPATEIPMEASA